MFILFFSFWGTSDFIKLAEHGVRGEGFTDRSIVDAKAASPTAKLHSP